MSAIGPFIQGPHSQNEIFSSRFSAPLKTRLSEILTSLAADAASSVIQFHLGVAEAYRRLGEKLLQANENENGKEASPLHAAILQRSLLQLPTGNMEPRFCDTHRIWPGRLDKIAVDFAA